MISRKVPPLPLVLRDASKQPSSDAAFEEPKFPQTPEKRGDPQRNFGAFCLDVRTLTFCQLVGPLKVKLLMLDSD